MNDIERRPLIIEAEPEPVTIDLSKTAVIVVDMQNAFVRRGGYFDLAGIDLSATEQIIGPCKEIITAARNNGIRIIYLQMGFSQDLSDKGAPDSPGSIKSRVLAFLKQRPEMKDRLYMYGTWGAEIIEELRPRPEDIIVRKQRYDGFIGTNLDMVLRTLCIRYLVFIGTATNVCVESTIRHAFFLEYHPILVSDAVSQRGPAITQEATLFNVRSSFGWVTQSEKLLYAISRVRDSGSLPLPSLP
jgi:ureidoacrylate peracid hydrolase